MEREIVDYPIETYSFYEPCTSDSMLFSMDSGAPSFTPSSEEVAGSSFVSLSVYTATIHVVTNRNYFIWSRKAARLSVLKKWKVPTTWTLAYMQRMECNIFILSKEVILSLCHLCGKGIWYVY
jgi:hypothetical protein